MADADAEPVDAAVVSEERKRGRGRGPRREEGGEDGAAAPAVTGEVPKAIKAKVREMLVASGPLVQSRFLLEWKQTFPDEPFDIQSWGFERLTDALESIDLLVITRDGAKKSYVSLKGGAAPPAVVESGGGREAAKGGMSRGAMSGVLAGLVASKSGSVDPAQVQAFMRQPKLQFTIDCLVEEFDKFSTGKGGNGGDGASKKKSKSRRRPPRAANSEAPAAASGADGTANDM